MHLYVYVYNFQNEKVKTKKIDRMYSSFTLYLTACEKMHSFLAGQRKISIYTGQFM